MILSVKHPYRLWYTNPYKLRRILCQRFCSHRSRSHKKSGYPSMFFNMASSCLLPCGTFGHSLVRRTRRYSWGRPVYLSELLWLTMSPLVARLSKNEYMLDSYRALKGLGPAVFMPSGMVLLSCYYWPALRKYLVFIGSSSIKIMTVHHQLQPIYSIGLKELQG
jgi:hypothetical protein